MTFRFGRCLVSEAGRRGVDALWIVPVCVWNEHTAQWLFECRKGGALLSFCISLVHQLSTVYTLMTEDDVGLLLVAREYSTFALWAIRAVTSTGAYRLSPYLVAADQSMGQLPVITKVIGIVERKTQPIENLVLAVASVVLNGNASESDCALEKRLTICDEETASRNAVANLAIDVVLRLELGVLWHDKVFGHLGRSAAREGLAEGDMGRGFGVKDRVVLCRDGSLFPHPHDDVQAIRSATIVGRSFKIINSDEMAAGKQMDWKDMTGAGNGAWLEVICFVFVVGKFEPIAFRSLVALWGL